MSTALLQWLTGPQREQGSVLRGPRPSRAASPGSWAAGGVAAAALPSGCCVLFWMIQRRQPGRSPDTCRSNVDMKSCWKAGCATKAHCARISTQLLQCILRTSVALATPDLPAASMLLPACNPSAGDDAAVVRPNLPLLPDAEAGRAEAQAVGPALAGLQIPPAQLRAAEADEAALSRSVLTG